MTIEKLYQDHIAQLSARYGEVLAKHGLDAVVLHTGTPLKKSVFDDQFWPLTVVPHTRHWLPLTVADCAVVVKAGAKPTLLYNVARDFWEGPHDPDSNHFWSAFDVVEVNGPDAMTASKGSRRVRWRRSRACDVVGIFRRQHRSRKPPEGSRSTARHQDRIRAPLPH
jgi:Xaa-Pro dipeptidase